MEQFNMEKVLLLFLLSKEKLPTYLFLHTHHSHPRLHTSTSKP